MGKVIKIQNNLNISSSYNAEQIEAVISGDMSQEIKYQTIDEYNIPYGTYATLRNYDDILFDEATLQSEVTEGEQTVEKVYTILQSSEVPDCEMMYNIFNTYYGGTCKGVVVMSTSEEIYNEIVVEAEEVISSEQGNIGDFRIKNIYLRGEYSSVNEALRQLQADSPVVFDFADIYPKCAKYWKLNNNQKTSTFDASQDKDLFDLQSFAGGFGEYTSGSDSGTGEEGYNFEKWNIFNVQDAQQSTMPYIMPDGKYYLHIEDTTSSTGNDTDDSVIIKDSDYNIFDVLFRYIYEYVYSMNERLGASDPMQVNDPSKYTFLLKTYKMYVKAPQNFINESSNSTSSETEESNTGSDDENTDQLPTLYYTGNSRKPATEILIPIETIAGITAESINSYSVKVLSTDEIKELSAEDAQEYFDNTIVHDVDNYKNKLILTEDEAKEVLIAKHITTCDKYFIISSNVGIKSPSSENYAYYDLGNFELVYDSPTSKAGKLSRNEYKYNTNGKIVRVRQIYDPYADEYYTISQNNSGEFAEGYPIERKGVCIRGISGKTDYYYFENTTDGEQQAEQFKEDILYAIEDGPSIVVAENLSDIVY